jgi:hypothetical protein
MHPRLNSSSPQQPLNQGPSPFLVNLLGNLINIKAVPRVKVSIDGYQICGPLWLMHLQSQMENFAGFIQEQPLNGQDRS